VNITRQPCASDYLEIIDLMNNMRVIELFCGRDRRPDGDIPAIAIRGPVSIHFSTMISLRHDMKTAKKNHRGFKISYALSSMIYTFIIVIISIECGGEINLTDADGSLSYSIGSPAFPLPYHHNLDCVWNISAPDDRVLTVK
jgi:hypothetical protein